jgi:hypothetical protein
MSEKSEHAPFLSVLASNGEQRKSAGSARSKPLAGLPFRKQSPLEPEDARITGSTRSLYRRLLALNLRKPVASELEAEAYLPPLTA